MFVVINKKFILKIMLVLLFNIAFYATAQAESIFPLLKDVVPKNRLHELPRPYGLSYVFFQQFNQFFLDTVELNDREIPSGVTERVTVYNIAKTNSLRGDVWVLPFLNLYGLIGASSGQPITDIKVPNLAQSNLDVALEWSAINYVFGGVFAFGFQNIFSSININRAWVFRDGATPIKAFSTEMRVGYKFNNIRPFVGSMYQYIPAGQNGSFAVGGHEIAYNTVLARSNPWNFTTGFVANFFDKGLELVMEVGYGERIQTAINVGYRWGNNL